MPDTPDKAVQDDGWILCSERMPEDQTNCIVTVETFNPLGETPNVRIVTKYLWIRGRFAGLPPFAKAIAWQPLPAPYAGPAKVEKGE